MRKQSLSPGALMAIFVGVSVVATLDVLGVLPAPPPGIRGSIWAGLLYGVGGSCGGLIVYALIKRLRGKSAD